MDVLRLAWVMALSLVLSLGLTGCFSNSVSDLNPVTQCEFKRHELNVVNPELRNDVSEALKYRSNDALRAKGDLLFLSGGNQRGAFGAGFLYGWSDYNPDTGTSYLPEFAIVTGVSTGALLSLAAFTNTPEAATAGYLIDGEHEVLNTYVQGGNLGPFEYLRAVQRGSLADLKPMRQTLRGIMQDYDLVAKISAGYTDRRRLYAILTNIKSGQAEAFDMTDMAHRIVTARDDIKKNVLTTCFVEAIAGSSSVPLAAPPVSIDGTLYMDGGARFGVMNDVIGEEIDRERVAPSPVSTAREAFVIEPPAQDRHIYAIINGTQSVKTLETSDNWDLLSFAKRSTDILANQVYLFSVQKIITDAMQEHGHEPYCVKIDPHYQLNPVHDKHPCESVEIRQATSGIHIYKGKTCDEWRDVDKEIDQPLQFSKRFMECLIDYGKERARREAWPRRALPAN